MKTEEGSERNLLVLKMEKGSREPREVGGLQKVENMKKQIFPLVSRKKCGELTPWLYDFGPSEL